MKITVDLPADLIKEIKLLAVDEGKKARFFAPRSNGPLTDHHLHLTPLANLVDTVHVREGWLEEEA